MTALLSWQTQATKEQLTLTIYRRTSSEPIDIKIKNINKRSELIAEHLDKVTDFRSDLQFKEVNGALFSELNDISHNLTAWIISGLEIETLPAQGVYLSGIDSDKIQKLEESQFSISYLINFINNVSNKELSDDNYSTHRSFSVKYREYSDFQPKIAFVRHLNGNEVKSLDEFKSIIEQLQEEGEESVLLDVEIYEPKNLSLKGVNMQTLPVILSIKKSQDEIDADTSDLF